MHRLTSFFHLTRPSRGLVGSGLTLLLAIFVAVGLVRLLGQEERPAVDTSAAYGAAATAGVFPVASPSQLPEGWRVLNADYRTEKPAAVLRVGLRAPGGGAVRLIESVGQAHELLTSALGGETRGQGSVEVAGRVWQRYLGAEGVRAIALLERGRTIIVAGAVNDRDLRALAGALVG